MRVYGKNPVIERIKADPRSIRKVYIQTGHPDAGYVYKKAQKWGIPIHAMARAQMDKLSRNVNAQGIMAEIGDFPYQQFDELLEQAVQKKMSLVFLDALKDPQNLGGMIRSLACLGGFALVLPTHDSVSVTEAVVRVACGGENFVPVAQVSNLARAIRDARDKGFWIAGAVTQDGADIRTMRMQFPLALVIGSEQKGIRPVISKLLDQAVTLPMAQQRLSLNAAHAAAIFCYEISRQRMKY